MVAPDGDDVTALLVAWNDGDDAAREALMSAVYAGLRQQAARFLGGERRDHTLQPTALVHEAYLRLVDQTRVRWRNRLHFYAIAARMMRRILLNHARERRAKRRGGGARHVSLSGVVVVGEARSAELVALDDALVALERLDERQARVVELRFFGGLTADEAAEVLGVSLATVKRDWTVAKAFLAHELEAGARS